MSAHVFDRFSAHGESVLGERGAEEGLVTRLLTWWKEGLERARQRRALARLDDHLLADIGLERMRVEEELSKPFWMR